jgi:NADH-quinone oxidoreductase subunit J
MKPLLLVGAGLIVLALVLAGAGAEVHAQAQPAGVAQAAHVGSPDATATVGQSSEHSGNKAQALLFWLFALMAVGGSLFVITRRNLVAAVMGLVGTFIAIAALYVMLMAHFIAVIQVLVYAGAVMVLFVFVVMILNRDEDEPWALQGLLGKAAASAALIYLLARIGYVLWRVQQTAPAELQLVGKGYGWGTTRAIGDVLFRDYLFPFEAVSLVLLIAVVGALAVARPPESHS